MSTTPKGSSPAAAPAPRGFEETLTLLSAVDGWLSDAQARRLWNAAAAVVAPGRIVEIGSFRGRSTIVLASAARDGVEVVAIDPHGGSDRGPQEIEADSTRGEQDFSAFRENLSRAGVEQRVRHVRAPSLEALGLLVGDVQMLYVDGAHRYRPASGDIAQWGSRVTVGGTMLVHDAFNAIGVMLAQLRLLLLSRRWRYRGRSGSLAEYRRERVSGLELVDSALRQLASVPYFIRNMVIKVLLVARLRRLARVLGHRSGDWPY